MRCWIRYPLQCYNDHISLTAFGGHVVARRHCRCILVGSLMSNTTRYIRNPSAHRRSKGSRLSCLVEARRGSFPAEKHMVSTSPFSESVRASDMRS
jgi:hypothetical protein